MLNSLEQQSIHRHCQALQAIRATQCFLQDREATLQCVLCLRARVEQRKSYSCSTDCLRQHWGEHKNLHQNGRKSSLQPLQHNDLPRAAVLY